MQQLRNLSGVDSYGERGVEVSRKHAADRERLKNKKCDMIPDLGGRAVPLGRFSSLQWAVGMFKGVQKLEGMRPRAANHCLRTKDAGGVWRLT